MRGPEHFYGQTKHYIKTSDKTYDTRSRSEAERLPRIRLYFGCRTSKQDFLYKEEWPEYAKELHGKFTLRTAFSREVYKPDGSKIYVQDLLWEDRETVADAILNGKGYVYICGDARSMSKAVEETLCKILGEAKGGSAEVEGVAEVKLLKERSRFLTDVWS